MLYVLLTLLALLTARPCVADEPIVVVGQEVDDEEEYARRPGFSRSVKPAESPVSTSVGDILQREAGVRVQQLGGPGQESRVMLRGTNSNHTVILLDGIPLTDVRFGESNLELVSPENIERIDIFQGYAPAGLDQGGIGGVVNIVSPVPQGNTARALAGYGSWNRVRAHLGASARHEEYFIQALGNYESADNDYPFLNDNGTPVINTDDDYTDRRHNADYTTRGAMVRAGSRGDRLDTDLLYEYYARRQGLPGLGSALIEQARREYRRDNASARARLHYHDSGEISALFGFSRQCYGLDDPHAELGLTATENEAEFRLFTGQLGLEELFLTGTMMRMSVEGNLEQVLRTSISESEVTSWPEQRRGRVSGTLALEQGFFDDRLTFLSQGRYEKIRTDFYDDFAYSTGRDATRQSLQNGYYSVRAGLRGEPVEKLVLRSNIMRGYRAPGFTELFGDQAYVNGNPDLLAETNTQVDAGAEYSLTAGPFVARCEYIWYRNYIDDLIIYLQNSQFTLRADNVGKAVIDGHQFSARCRLYNRIEIWGTCTIQRAEDRGDIPAYYGKQLPHRPLYDCAGGASLTAYGCTISADMEYVGGNYGDRVNSRYYYIDHRVQYNSALIYSWLMLKARAELRNITGEQIKDITGAPLPGRQWYASLACEI